MRPARSPAGILTILFVAGTVGCTTPPGRYDAEAVTRGFTRTVVRGGEFDHVVYAANLSRSSETLHVYLEGDGSPYLASWLPAPDPTPRNPVMLRLMALDEGPAVLVGRPCYSGLSTTPPCAVPDWTTARFAPRVVDSLQIVIEGLRERYAVRHIALFGHSGGGALAILLARRVEAVDRVVTLAGNLDTAAWTEIHGYSPLAGSINPVDQGPLPAGIRQQHFIGDRDRNVPAPVVARAATVLGAAGIEVVAGVGHNCCWETHWPAILAGR